jgi:hypothetical protein
VNTVDVEPCGTVTVAGTLAAVVLELERDTATPPVPAASVRLTVPVPDRPLTIVLGLTETLLSATGGGLMVIPNVTLAPEYEAVKVTGVAVLTVPAVTENVAEVEPCGIVTVAGTLARAGEALSAIVAPPLSAAEVTATVQVDPADGVSVVGVHEMALNTGVWRIVTVPPLAEVDIPVPAESAETPLVSWTDEDVSGVESAKVKVTEATTLFGIVVELRPHTKHVALPEPLLQESDLFAAADPAAKLADVKSVVE